MFQRICVSHILFQCCVSLTIISLERIVLAQISVADVHHHIRHGIIRLLRRQNLRHLLYVMLLHCQSDADGVAVIFGCDIPYPTEERLYLVQQALRLCEAVHIKINVGEVYLAKIHVEVVLQLIVFKLPLHTEEHL